MMLLIRVRLLYDRHTIIISNLQATSLGVLHNYFDILTKLFSNLIFKSLSIVQFLDISAQGHSFYVQFKLL